MAITKCESEAYRYSRADDLESAKNSFQTNLQKANNPSPRDDRAGAQQTFDGDQPIPRHLTEFTLNPGSFSTRWDGPILGIAQQSAAPGLWPYRMYVREGVADRRDQKALQLQLAATPWLDREAFGMRPAAPLDADRKIRNGDAIVILDATRMKFLEDQRDYLDVARSARNGTERLEAKGLLVDAIRREIDYASTLQGVPISAQDRNVDGAIDPSELGNLVRSIADRAPVDPIFTGAVEEARELMQREWQADGRTRTQLGVLLEAAEKRDYARVAKETERQLLDVARAAANGQQSGTSEIKLATLLKRAGVYETYYAGDKDSYQKAVATGVEAAKEELFKAEPVRQLQAAWGNGGADGASAFAARLAAVTSTGFTLPGYGAKIMSDPQVVGMLDQALNEVSFVPTNENFARQEEMSHNLAAASQSVLYGDGREPGEGKQAVDRLASKLLAKVNAGVERNKDSHMAEFLRPFADAVGNGDAALMLSFAAQATGEPRQLAITLAKEAIARFGDAMNAHGEKASAAWGDLYHGLAAFPADKLQRGDDQVRQRNNDLAKLAAQNPDKVRKLNDLGNELDRMWEKQESIGLALEHYRPALTAGNADAEPLQRAYENLQPLPIEQLAKLADDNQKLPGTLWVQRSTRNLATIVTVELLTKTVKPGRLRDVLVGKLPPEPLPGVLAPHQPVAWNENLLGRGSKGLSSYLFAANTMSVLNSDDWLDVLFAVPHGTAAVAHGLDAIVPNWKATAFGIDPKTNNPNTPFQKWYNSAASNVDGMRVSDGAKNWMKGVLAAVLKDMADVGYVLADGTNAVVHGARGDWITSLGYGLSVAGDLAFLAGPGVNAVQTVGPATAASGLQAGTGGNAASRFLMARGRFFYSGIGAVVMLMASSVVTGRGAWKTAHKFDAADADYLTTVLGVRSDIAAKLAEHNDFQDRDLAGYASLILPNENLLGGPPLMRSAGTLMMASLGALGYSRSDFSDTVNSWSPDQAEKIADYIKEQAGILTKTEDPLEPEELLAYAKSEGIPLPDRRLS
ncbi:hypothetical protein IB262_33285 [Ensifer sp. ENS02]|uniref:hypothetical protein n=1 Tax=Ensifer sp. ENS02 TaxID=2769290 RepID=UPI001780891A|nr:hypothetical protein [Ensifer sp. ENS02]MBD9524751.1 hypothetical protein [Ensifer sp. ENS02]